MEGGETFTLELKPFPVYTLGLVTPDLPSDFSTNAILSESPKSLMQARKPVQHPDTASTSEFHADPLGHSPWYELTFTFI